MTVVSSPGKVLLAGGYLVLDPTHRGIVISTSSRFYTLVHPFHPPQANTITVRSPQFINASWTYAFEPSTGLLLELVDQQLDSGKNKFVRIALEKTLVLAGELVGTEGVKEALVGGLEIIIVGDNDFYSQRKQLESLSLPLAFSSLSHLPPFSQTHTTLSTVHKTGLGSSAALITSLCAALLLHLKAVEPCAFDLDADSTSDGRKGMGLIHNLAQYAHCLAQGKIGSGFDVSSAVWGSQLYRKFGVDALEDLMKDDTSKPKDLLSALRPENPKWTNEVEPFSLPPQTTLLLADVDAGSDTPSLVGKILRWKKEHPEQDVWPQISTLNEDFAIRIRALNQLAHSNPVEYDRAVQTWLDPIHHPESEQTKPFIEAFNSIRTQSQSIRKAMKAMGDMAGVPIEPDEQTALLDECQALPGVLGCGVPGAGGYDALWVLVLDTPSLPNTSPVEAVGDIWTGWKSMSLCPLSARADANGGLQIHSVDQVRGLREACGLDG